MPEYADVIALPNIGLFKQAVQYAKIADKAAIIDTRAGIQRTYPQLVTDAIAMRKKLLDLTQKK